MTNEKEIGRITHENIEYVLGVSLIDIGMDQKVPYPYILVTTKTSRKKRDKKLSEKNNEHFNRLPINNAIGFYKKVYPVFDEFLKKYNYVSFSAHSDSQEKRVRVYTKALEKMGFNFVYVYRSPWDRSFVEYVMARDGFIPKKKEIIKAFKALYE